MRIHGTSGLQGWRSKQQLLKMWKEHIPFFRETEIQSQLTNILFIYASTHPRIGYRQGMHELLAPLYYAIYFDSVDESAAVEPELREICSVAWIAADAWALFDTVMDGVSTWYEWREPDYRTLAAERQPGIAGHVHLVAPNGPNGLQPWVAPIVKACNHIQNELLKKVDPALWNAMSKAGIEPQIYGIRWLRMLFTREFSMTDTMKLWDGLFACDPTLALAQWVCVAMLIRIRGNLINADYSSQLTTLLRYPSPSRPLLDDAPIHTCLLLQQALSLQLSPTPSTAATIAMENRSLLGIPIEPAEHHPPSPKKRVPLTRHHSGFVPTKANGAKDASTPGHSRQASSPPLGLSEMLSRGLLERGESLGINKTLLSAVSELKVSDFNPSFDAVHITLYPEKHTGYICTGQIANI
ncbi:TBC1 domain family member 5 isoform CRAb [Coprinopsis cinerea okayama7|uniref:TBC1 domain family member 5 isoform CRAb n=1 Tax=Coprinopsis cinerea (strain Okayama-7 / 130 / ATCC MYA-4618 / FGSC 9003) TaxID=240176 RepID=A8NFL0_COPC7|nr:TBC1 domain family member 5 isoform CRAb [Coprinopsis cinerea okayama7\|eukprot:XP_001833313.1 TBC1 domain family member 5 isoform CRAb [Coprinopsis cinerea okayama7\